jgi:hypothetical protein
MGIAAVVLVVAVAVYAFFFLLPVSIPAETALFTESMMSRLCSRYSVSLYLCFFPASCADSPGMVGKEEAPEVEGYVWQKRGRCRAVFRGFLVLRLLLPLTRWLGFKVFCTNGCDEEREGRTLASLMVLGSGEVAATRLLLVRPPAARNREPKPPLSPCRRGTMRKVMNWVLP